MTNRALPNARAVNSIEAVFTGGGFHPVHDVDFGLGEGALVRLSVESIDAAAGDKVLQLAAKVYEGLSADDIDDVERIAINRGDYFSCPPDDDRNR